jgi:hypothetical protein
MNRTRLFCIILLLLTSSRALGQDVRYNFDDKADFSKFKTYTWVILKNAKPVDDLADKQIKAAVDAVLIQKGLTKVDGDAADLYIGYQAAVGTQQELT